MLVHNALTEREADAGPAAFRRVEEFEDMWQNVGRNRRPAVGQAASPTSDRGELRVESEFGTLRGGVTGIHQDIAKDLPQLFGVDQTAHWLVGPRTPEYKLTAFETRALAVENIIPHQFGIERNKMRGVWASKFE